MHITFIGGGNMATALIGGLIQRGTPARQIEVVELLDTARTKLSEQFGVNVVADPQHMSPTELVVLAVKPQQMKTVCAELAPRLGTALVVSIAAGLRLADLSRWLGGCTRLVRAMPNTPALIGRGVAGLCAAPGVADSDRARATALLEAVGTVVWVDDETAIDAVTAVSGSGPAYVFYFIEAMQRAAQALGLTVEQARQLSLATFSGAAELAAMSTEPPSTLRERVTSKGGTTEAALKSMAASAVDEAIVAAIAAAAARGRELGAQLGAD